MKHGYTNVTEHVGATMTKTYVGPHAARRAQTERLALMRLQGKLPVPAVIAAHANTLVAAFIDGRHGQDLLADGFAREVLTECGRVLQRLHSIEPSEVFDAAGEGVIVHGDFGPNNVLFAPQASAVTAVLDWEFCHVGERIEDLAWSEWITRAHHPEAVAELPSFFEGYGWMPPWQDRQEVMVQRCAALAQFCGEWDPRGNGVAQWQERGRQTAAWRE